MAQALRSDLHDVSRGPVPRRPAGTEPAGLTAGLRDATHPLEDRVLHDLPPAGTRRWVPRHKAAVVAAVEAGMLTLDDVRERYFLSEEELEQWRDTVLHYGIVGLRMSVNERRSAPRLAVSEHGYAGLGAGERVACVITDVSDNGARIEVDAKVALPGYFELECAASGRSWWVDLVWQRGAFAGVRFTNPLSPPFALTEGLGEWLVGRRDQVAIGRKG